MNLLQNNEQNQRDYYDHDYNEADNPFDRKISNALRGKRKNHVEHFLKLLLLLNKLSQIKL